MPDHFHICVDVPNVTKTCFIAMPFSGHKALDPLYTVIQQAATNEKLQPYRTDKVSPKPNFVNQIIEEVRKAWILVAAFPPNEGESTFNNNVMYELGLAHALGKPTIILMDLRPGEAPPADIRIMNYTAYSASELDGGNKKALIAQVQLLMKELIERSKSNEHLVDPEWQGIEAFPAAPCAKAKLRGHVKEILQEAGMLMEHFSEMTHYLTQLREGIDKIAHGGYPSQYILKEFNEYWQKFENKFRSKETQKLINGWKTDKERLNNAFDKLQYEPNGGVIYNQSIKQAKEYFHWIEENMNVLNKYHNAFATEIQDGDFSYLMEEQVSIETTDSLNHIELTTSRISSHTRNMVIAMISTLD